MLIASKKIYKNMGGRLAILTSICGFCLERFPLPLGAWDGLRYFIVAPP